MPHKSLCEYEVTCVVSCQHKASADVWTSSAIFISPLLVLAPACILQTSDSEILASDIGSHFKFQLLICSDEGTLITAEADHITSWKCLELATVVDKLFSNDIQLDLFDTPSEETLAIDLISKFLLLQVPEKYRSPRFLCLKEVGKVRSYAQLLTCSTPFGSHGNIKCFYNSWNCGIVSKDIGQGVAFLSDVACVPGGQGGLAYLEDMMVPVGIVIYPAVWRLGSSTGLSIIAGLSAVVNSLQAHLIEVNITYPQITNLVTNTVSSLVAPSNAHSRTVRIRTNNLWGSGILLSNAYVLTCSHVVNDISMNILLVECHNKQLTATLVYKSDNIENFDVAILKLSTCLDGIKVISSVQQATAGMAVVAEGYGLFSCGTTPIISSGVIAKVYTVEAYSCNLVTTCRVHAGASGGPVMDKYGRIVAMIIANMYDYTNQTEYNNISLAISFYTLYPAISKLYKTDSASYFKCLEKGFDKLVVNGALQSKL
ncbi:peroxisomal leader peptide-processing protease-like [Watersipora subatra]|uniref:peroxisomal leader peptide-processing protease-like n=1 Tax=Watersipora subatra TaxID=2589382 RepID=UPI00355B87D7